jgi:hypothetical protein
VIVEIPDDATYKQAQEILRAELTRIALQRHRGRVADAAASLGLSRWGLHKITSARRPKRTDEIVRRLEAGDILHRVGRTSRFVWHGTKHYESENAVRFLQLNGRVKQVAGVVVLVAPKCDSNDQSRNCAGVAASDS